ncbi:MAG: restriction endonuclease subunit S [Microbacteriaceae bacterium]
MSRIDELIQDLCPAGVEFKELGGCIARNVGGGTPSRSKRQYWDGDVHWASVGDITATTLKIRDTRQTITAEGLQSSSSNLVPEGWLVVAVKIVPGAMRVVEQPIAINQDIRGLLLNDELDPYFLTYYFKTLSVVGNGTIVKGITNQTLMRIRIPVPPLEVQREIVGVLDKFTQLEAELEAELEARRVQYEHYRNALLMSSDERGVRNVSLGDIIRLNFGVRITKKNDSGTLYPVYGGGGESFRTDAFNREDEWVVSRFAMSANCVRRVDGKFWMLDSGFTFDVIDDAVDKDFVGQLLLSMQSIIFATSTQSAQKNIDVNGFKRLQVQFPSLATQQRVAASLANFDRIVNDLSIGLPAELAARRKQYEHYRDRLLTFKELTS